MRAVTSKGLEVELRYYPEIKDGIKDGWVVHLIEAAVAGEPAGYIKVSYIPGEKFEQLFATPFDYAVQESGSNLRIRTLLAEKREDDWAPKELRKAIEDTYHFLAREERERLEALDEAGLRERWSERRQFLDDDYRHRHQQFKSFHLDKPRVDYIRVYGDSDVVYYDGGQRKDHRSGRDWRRQGIGTVLYEAAALWMAEQDLYLWAASNWIQSGEARRAWAHLGEKYELVRVLDEGGKERLYLDGRRVSLGRPQSPQFSDLEVAPEARDAQTAPDRQSPQISS